MFQERSLASGVYKPEMWRAAAIFYQWVGPVLSNGDYDGVVYDSSDDGHRTKCPGSTWLCFPTFDCNRPQ